MAEMSEDSASVDEIDAAMDQEAVLAFQSFDDYAKAAKLRSIYEAREGFRRLLLSQERVPAHMWEHRFWVYAVELAPIIRDAIDGGIIDSDSTVLHPDFEVTALQFADRQRHPDDDLPRSRKGWIDPQFFWLAFRTLTQLEHQLGLGFKLETADPPMQL